MKHKISLISLILFLIALPSVFAAHIITGDGGGTSGWHVSATDTTVTLSCDGGYLDFYDRVVDQTSTFNNPSDPNNATSVPLQTYNSGDLTVVASSASCRVRVYATEACSGTTILDQTFTLSPTNINEQSETYFTAPGTFSDRIGELCWNVTATVSDGVGGSASNSATGYISVKPYLSAPTVDDLKINFFQTQIFNHNIQSNQSTNISSLLVRIINASNNVNLDAEFEDTTPATSTSVQLIDFDTNPSADFNITTNYTGWKDNGHTYRNFSNGSFGSNYGFAPRGQQFNLTDDITCNAIYSTGKLLFNKGETTGAPFGRHFNGSVLDVDGNTYNISSGITNRQEFRVAGSLTTQAINTETFPLNASGVWVRSMNSFTLPSTIQAADNVTGLPYDIYFNITANADTSEKIGCTYSNVFNVSRVLRVDSRTSGANGNNGTTFATNVLNLGLNNTLSGSVLHASNQGPDYNSGNMGGMTLHIIDKTTGSVEISQSITATASFTTNVSQGLNNLTNGYAITRTKYARLVDSFGNYVSYTNGTDNGGRNGTIDLYNLTPLIRTSTSPSVINDACVPSTSILNRGQLINIGCYLYQANGSLWPEKTDTFTAVIADSITSSTEQTVLLEDTNGTGHISVDFTSGSSDAVDALLNTRQKFFKLIDSSNNSLSYDNTTNGTNALYNFSARLQPSTLCNGTINQNSNVNATPARYNRGEAANWSLCIYQANGTLLASKSSITLWYKDNASAVQVIEAGETTNSEGVLDNIPTFGSANTSENTYLGRPYHVALHWSGNYLSYNAAWNGTSNGTFNVSSWYLTNVHVEKDITRSTIYSNVTFPNENSTDEVPSGIIAASVFRAWVEVLNTRNESLSGLSPTVSFYQPDGSLESTSSALTTGADGWTTSFYARAASLFQEGTGFVTGNVTNNGNTGGDVDSLKYISPYTGNLQVISSLEVLSGNKKNIFEPNNTIRLWVSIVQVDNFVNSFIDSDNNVTKVSIYRADNNTVTCISSNSMVRSAYKGLYSFNFTVNESCGFTKLTPPYMVHIDSQIDSKDVLAGSSFIVINDPLGSNVIGGAAVYNNPEKFIVVGDTILIGARYFEERTGTNVDVPIQYRIARFNQSSSELWVYNETSNQFELVNNSIEPQYYFNLTKLTDIHGLTKDNYTYIKTIATSTSSGWNAQDYFLTFRGTRNGSSVPYTTRFHIYNDNRQEADPKDSQCTQTVQQYENISCIFELAYLNATPLTGQTPTINITAPDGTTSQTTMTEVLNGAYEHSFNATQYGKYKVRMNNTLSSVNYVSAQFVNVRQTFGSTDFNSTDRDRLYAIYGNQSLILGNLTNVFVEINNSELRIKTNTTSEVANLLSTLRSQLNSNISTVLLEINNSEGRIKANITSEAGLIKVNMTQEAAGIKSNVTLEASLIKTNTSAESITIQNMLTSINNTIGLNVWNYTLNTSILGDLSAGQYVLRINGNQSTYFASWNASINGTIPSTLQTIITNINSTNTTIHAKLDSVSANLTSTNTTINAKINSIDGNTSAMYNCLNNGTCTGWWIKTYVQDRGVAEIKILDATNDSVDGKMYFFDARGNWLDLGKESFRFYVFNQNQATLYDSFDATTDHRCDVTPQNRGIYRIRCSFKDISAVANNSEYYLRVDTGNVSQIYGLGFEEFTLIKKVDLTVEEKKSSAPTGRFSLGRAYDIMQTPVATGRVPSALASQETISYANGEKTVVMNSDFPVTILDLIILITLIILIVVKRRRIKEIYKKYFG